MYARIMGSGKFEKVEINPGHPVKVEIYNIYDASMRTVINRVTGLSNATAWLEGELKREYMMCPTGKCED